MTAIEILRNEHTVILQTLDLLERHASTVKAGGPLNAEFAGWILQFLREFADDAHHAKEEGVLFRMLEARGLPRGSGMLAVMLAEHESSRAMARDMLQALGRKNAPAFAAAGLRLADLLRRHMLGENETLFRIVETMLTPVEDSAVLEAFGRVVHERDGVLIRQRHLAAMKRWRISFSP